MLGLLFCQTKKTPNLEEGAKNEIGLNKKKLATQTKLIKVL